MTHDDDDRTAPGRGRASSEDETVGSYRILDRVGTGGMGEVYRAEQSEPIRRTVALKIIKRGMDTREVITRFEAERQALALMDHPAIAKVFDAGSTPRGRPYFAMEYVKGVPITTYCDEHKLSVRERLELFIQLCEGVQHAHQKAIIHRDLKPSNVLVTSQDNKPAPKIIDFGVAKATAQKLTEKTMYTALGEMIGTPEYMSPEQAALTGEDVDTRTDVYALGVILYELLAGALPFDPTELRAAGFEGIIRMLREQDPPRPSTRVGALGERETDVARARRTLPGKLANRLRGDLDWIAIRALEKDRTRRYGSPAELAADVRRHLRHEPVAAGPPSAVYRARKFVRRHTLGVGIASAAGLVLLAFAVTMAMQANRIARERDRADQEATTSDRVSEFLVGVFNVSDPGEARGNTITAREVLDNGALRVQHELRDQPLLRAKMMDTMGRVYQNLGLYATAESLLAGAIEIRTAELGAEHLDTIASLNHLGYVFYQTGRLEEALEAHESVLSVRKAVLGDHHVDTAWSRYYLGMTRIAMGEAVRARTLFEEALADFEAHLGPKHLAVAWCLNDLGRCAASLAGYESAFPYVTRSLEIKQDVLGSDHWDVGVAQGNVGYVLMNMERYDEARTYLERGMSTLERSLGRDHRRFANQLQTLGELQRRTGDYEASRSSLMEAHRILQARVTPQHWTLAEVQHSLALVAQATGDYAEADSLFRQVTQSREKNQPGSLLVAETLEDHAALLREMGRPEEAKVMEAQSTAIREKLTQSNDANQ